MSTQVQAIIDWYSSLTEESLSAIENYYAEDAYFKDPFNEVRGSKDIKRIFEHMFRTTVKPRFEFQDVIEQGDQVFLTWTFRFGLDQREYQVTGGSHLILGKDGKIQMHRDYWDPAEELWQKLPILGGIIRWLRGKFKAH